VAAALCLASLPGCNALKKGDGKDKDKPEEAAKPGGVQRSPQEQAFLAKCAEMSKNPGSVAGRDGWFFSTGELQRFSGLTDPNAPSIRAAVAAIADYHDQLKREGAELVFVPVPPKAVIFPDELSKDLKIKVRGKKTPRLDSTLQETWEALRKKGVNVIDPTDALLAARDDRKLGPVFTKTSAAWSPRGAEITAALVAKEFKDAKWARDPGKAGPLITEAGTVTFTGTLASGKVAPEILPVRNIGRSADGKMSSVTFSQGGHALAILGDETMLAWREANNPERSKGTFASLADQLAFELQTTPDLFPGNGNDGRNSARLKILREGTNGARPLGSAKVVLWVIDATDLAFSDWKKVPLRMEFNLNTPELQLSPASGSPVPGAGAGAGGANSGTDAGTAPAPSAPAGNTPGGSAPGQDSGPVEPGPGIPELPR
jgi:alginate O-acetyltransferase complex protein AlgJ